MFSAIDWWFFLSRFWKLWQLLQLQSPLLSPSSTKPTWWNQILLRKPSLSLPWTPQVRNRKFPKQGPLPRKLLISLQGSPKKTTKEIQNKGSPSQASFRILWCTNGIYPTRLQCKALWIHPKFEGWGYVLWGGQRTVEFQCHEEGASVHPSCLWTGQAKILPERNRNQSLGLI